MIRPRRHGAVNTGKRAARRVVLRLAASVVAVALWVPIAVVGLAAPASALTYDSLMTSGGKWRYCTRTTLTGCGPQGSIDAGTHLHMYCYVDDSEATGAYTSKSPMGDAHKAALAEGRANARAVRRYLELLESNKPKRGRKRTPDSIRKQLAAIENQMPDTSVLSRLQFIQQRTDLADELGALEVGGNSIEALAAAEADFVGAAAAYAVSKGISAATFRAMGVPASVLKAAGINR